MAAIRLMPNPAGLGAPCSQGGCLAILRSIIALYKRFTVRGPSSYTHFQVSFSKFNFRLESFVRDNVQQLFIVFHFASFIQNISIQ